MKKGIYIALFLLGFSFVSCQKQNVVPNMDAVQDIPIWESSANRGSVIIDEDDNGSDDPSGIVDPNNPSDGLKKP